MLGASWVRTHILNAHPHAKLTVYAIWVPMLYARRHDWDAHVLDDPRVVNLWDGSLLLSRWVGDHSIGGRGKPGDVIWDAYYAFGQHSRWRSEPNQVLVTGSTIIDNTSGLEQHFIPLLESH